MERIALFGATSGIARAVAEELLARGEALLLLGRSSDALEALAKDLEVIGGKPVPWLVWDVLDFQGHALRFEEMRSRHSIKGLFMAAGIGFPQTECDGDAEKTRLIFDTNLTGPVLVMDLFAAHFREKRSGFISCLSSVAGDRGRGSITAYAASKAGLTAYLAGLANRLQGTGVLIQTVKPGYVDTRMTVGLRSPLMASSAWVAKDIVTALDRKRERLYTPAYWKYIMLAIRMIPEPLFRKLGL